MSSNSLQSRNRTDRLVKRITVIVASDLHLSNAKFYEMRKLLGQVFSITEQIHMYATNTMEVLQSVFYLFAMNINRTFDSNA